MKNGRNETEKARGTKQMNQLSNHSITQSLNRSGSLFWRLWWRALSVERPQAALALGCLFVAASIASLLLNLYGDVRRKMTEEFRTYGSNVVLAPALPRGETGADASSAGAVMDEASLRPLRAFERRRPGLAAAPILYGIVRLARTAADPRLPEFVNVMAVGTDFAGLRHIYAGWRGGEMNSQSLLVPGTCVLGAHLATKRA